MTISPTDFKGFDNTKYLYSILEADRHKDLRNFTEKLFVQVSNCNQARYVNPLVGERARFFDSMALLLTGDETCGAVAISGPNVLIATNRTRHDLKAATYSVKGAIVNKSRDQLTVEFFCLLKVDEIGFEQSSFLQVIFNFDHAKKTYIPASGEKRLPFVFKTPGLIEGEDNSVVTISYSLRELPTSAWQEITKKELLEEFEVQKPVAICVGSLQRRAAKIVTNLSLIARVIFEQQRWKSENQTEEVYKRYSAFVNLKYDECADVTRKSPVGFLEFIDRESRESLVFPNILEHFDFMLNALNHYHSLDKIDETQKYLETNPRWVEILRDSLTYELSKYYSGKIWIEITTPAAKGETGLRDFYLAIAKAYRNKSSDVSVEDWLNTLPRRFQDGEFKAPQEVLDDLPSFFQKAQHYLKGIEHREELGLLYKALVVDYVQFKKDAHLKTCVSSAQQWLSLTLPKLSLGEFKVPQFILDKPNFFLDRTQRYFIALARIEEFIAEDAANDGELSNLLMKESIFNKPISVKIIDGRDNIHAEMRLLDHHLRTGAPPSDYYGIAMLCCGLCNYTLKRLKVPGARVAQSRGAHTTLHDKWVLMEAFHDDQVLNRFLGDPLFQNFQTLQSKVRHLDAPMKNGKRKDESQYRISDVALGIIPRLGGLNNAKALRRLNIDTKYLIKGSDKVFAEEDE